MEDELLRRVYRLLRELTGGRGPRVLYGDATIVLVYFRAVVCDRPVSWACDPRHRPRWYEGPWPSASTVSRRRRRDSAQRLLRAVEARLLGAPPAPRVSCYLIDAKPMLVSDYSKDRQAKRGFAYKGFARGYKLYAICDLDRRLVAYHVDSMNESERTVAARLIPRARGPGYLVGDAMYDADHLYRTAAAHGLHLVAPRNRRGGVGNRPQHPDRLHAIALLETGNAFGTSLYAARYTIEQYFASLTNRAWGLKGLPNWVRTLPRVRQWIQAKIILHALAVPTT